MSGSGGTEVHVPEMRVISLEGSQTDGRTDRQKDRYREIERERQIEREIYICIHTQKAIYVVKLLSGPSLGVSGVVIWSK